MTFTFESLHALVASIAEAIAKANRHPEPLAYAQTVIEHYEAPPADEPAPVVAVAAELVSAVPPVPAAVPVPDQALTPTAPTPAPELASAPVATPAAA